MITSFRCVRSSRRVLAFLAAAVTVLVGLGGAGPASATTTTYTYDTAVYVYDAPARLPPRDTVATDARGAPAGRSAAPWVSHASLVWFGVAAEAGTGAESAIAGRDLGRQLASDQQMAEAGTALAGAGSSTKLRAAERLAADYGGSAEDWAKMGSSTYRGADGFQFETHWYEVVVTGGQFEFKTKF